MSKNELIQIHPYVDKEVSAQFERLYPHCRQRFISNAMKICLTDMNFFQKIFFMDLYPNIQGALNETNA